LRVRHFREFESFGRGLLIDDKNLMLAVKLGAVVGNDVEVRGWGMQRELLLAEGDRAREVLLEFDGVTLVD
jgi:hypothetical protein